MLEHGGKLRRASIRTGIPVEQWLDLSTGIAPWSYMDERSDDKIPSSLWHRLPEDDDDILQNTIARYYGGGEHWLPIAGSQAAIQTIPRIISTKLRVGICMPSYNEHSHAWRKAGHSIVEFEHSAWHDAIQNDAPLERVDALIVCNPNNPTGHHFPPQRLMEIAEELGRRGGLLIVDEAFADTQPHMSVVPLLGNRNDSSIGLNHERDDRTAVVVLRSLGKFFGLAGARVGFVHAPPAVRHALVEELGPWTLSGPSRYIAQSALTDSAWHESMRTRLAQNSRRLGQILEQAGLPVSGQTDFFAWVRSPQALKLHEDLQSRAILTRYFATPASIRFGLPADDAGYERLAHALTAVVRRCELNHVP